MSAAIDHRASVPMSPAPASLTCPDPEIAPGRAFESLPPEVVLMMLEAGKPWSADDVRAISQSHDKLDTYVREVEPKRYAQVHQPTLHHAMRRKRFPFDNARAQKVLGQFETLRLLGQDDATRRRITCDPVRMPEAQLRQLMQLTPHVVDLRLGRQARDLMPLFRMGQSGLQVGNLTTLCLRDTAMMQWAQVDWLVDSLASMAKLEVLRLPPRLTGTTGVPLLNFEALPHLREFDWRMQVGAVHPRVDLTKNNALTTFRFGPPEGHANMLGLELEPTHVSMGLPRSPLQVLQLQNVSIEQPFAEYGNSSSWSLNLIRLDISAEILVPSLDLSGYSKLTSVRIHPRSASLHRLQLPPAQLVDLDVGGEGMSHVLIHLGGGAQSPLRRLALRISDNALPLVPLPWQHWPNLTDLTLDVRCFDPFEASQLGLPTQNAITHLTLGSDRSRRFLDYSLGRLQLPHLQHLDLTGILWGQHFVEMVRLAILFGRWPRLATVRIDAKAQGQTPAMLDAMQRLARSYGFTLER